MEIISVFIKRFTGMPLGVFLRKRFFEPLGMKNTAFVPTAEMKKNIATMHQRDGQSGNIALGPHIGAEALTDGYTEETDKFYHQGGAGIWSTVGDFCSEYSFSSDETLQRDRYKLVCHMNEEMY